jgi:hypothetical protein
MVDEAKAFCPGCGNAFVEEEKRTVSSSFDTMDSTVQLGQTMYDQMLVDMGLHTSKSPDAQDKRAEVVVPLAPLTPAARPAAQEPSTAAPSSVKRWLLIAGLLIALLFLVLIALGIAGFIFYSSFR